MLFPDFPPSLCLFGGSGNCYGGSFLVFLGRLLGLRYLFLFCLVSFWLASGCCCLLPSYPDQGKEHLRPRVLWIRWQKITMLRTSAKTTLFTSLFQKFCFGSVEVCFAAMLYNDAFRHYVACSWWWWQWTVVLPLFLSPQEGVPA